MANYTKSTNFAIKDSLISGDPAKIVKGTEIDTELVNIQSAVNSKRDSSGIVPVSNGGTGAATLTGVLRGNGTSAVTAGNVNLSTEVSNTLPIANGGTGQTTYTNGQLLIGNSSSGLTKATITAGSNITVTNGSGSITIASTAGTGDVSGPASATDTHIVSFNGATGKVIGQANTVTLGSLKFGRGGGNVDGNICLGSSITFASPSTTGTDNIGIGNSVYLSALTGNDNIAIGDAAGSIVSSGTYNVLIGSLAGYVVTGGDYNICIGNNAGQFISNGNYNTALGTDSLQSISKTNCATLGYEADVTANDQVQLGNASTTTFVYGTVQNRSDLRDKADVRDTQLGLNFIKALRPVDYKWDMREDYKPAKPGRKSFETAEAYKEAMTAWQQEANISNITHNGTHKRTRYHHGLVAQEVKAVLDEQGIDFGGYQDHAINGGDDVLSIGYDELIAPMIKAIQELKAELDSVKAELAALKAN